MESCSKQFGSNLSRFLRPKFRTKKRGEDELHLSSTELDAKENELQRTISGLKQQLSELQEFNVDNNTLDLENNEDDVKYCIQL